MQDDNDANSLKSFSQSEDTKENMEDLSILHVFLHGFRLWRKPTKDLEFRIWH